MLLNAIQHVQKKEAVITPPITKPTTNVGKINFTIDGKSYEGTMGVSTNTIAGCPTSKAIVITNSAITHTITMLNYKSSSDSIYDPLVSGNGDSCTKIWFAVADGSTGGGYLSVSGTWQVTGTTFTLTAVSKAPGSSKTHAITATGTLQ